MQLVPHRAANLLFNRTRRVQETLGRSPATSAVDPSECLYDLNGGEGGRDQRKPIPFPVQGNSTSSRLNRANDHIGFVITKILDHLLAFSGFLSDEAIQQIKTALQTMEPNQ